MVLPRLLLLLLIFLKHTTRNDAELKIYLLFKAFLFRCFTNCIISMLHAERRRALSHRVCAYIIHELNTLPLLFVAVAVASFAKQKLG
jgi:hypothetical protein